jgi:hypothetical protein
MPLRKVLHNLRWAWRAWWGLFEINQWQERFHSDHELAWRVTTVVSWDGIQPVHESRNGLVALTLQHRSCQSFFAIREDVWYREEWATCENTEKVLIEAATWKGIFTVIF